MAGAGFFTAPRCGGAAELRPRRVGTVSSIFRDLRKICKSHAAALSESYRRAPKKKTAAVPGPVWLPMTAPRCGGAAELRPRRVRTVSSIFRDLRKICKSHAAALSESYRRAPKKKTAAVPGPVWLPMTAPSELKLIFAPGCLPRISPAMNLASSPASACTIMISGKACGS